jgi:hypothetical protein
MYDYGFKDGKRRLFSMKYSFIRRCTCYDISMLAMELMDGNEI